MSQLCKKGITFQSNDVNLIEILKGHGLEFYYSLLGRLQMDCDYYLGYGGRNPKHLWANNEVKQLELMKTLWNGLPDKPQWLTLEEILEYEDKMTNFKEDDELW